VAKDITELRKAALRREQEKKEMEDVVEQDKLVEIRSEWTRSQASFEPY
jgi:nucleosome binding factor SPN SPT16 subunit